MELPRLTTVDGMYQYLIGGLLVLALLFGLLFGAMYVGLLSF